MTAIFSRIRSDLRRTLMQVPGLPAEVKWEGRAYKPKPGVAYVAERIDPVASMTATLGSQGSVEERAIYAVDVYWPANDTMHGGEDLADGIRTTFWHGRHVGSSGPVEMWGTVLTSQLALPLESDGWLQHPVRITFIVRRPTIMA